MNVIIFLYFLKFNIKRRDKTKCICKENVTTLFQNSITSAYYSCIKKIKDTHCLILIINTFL